MPQEIRLEALDFASIIRAGDHIVWGAGPPALVAKLLEQRHRIGHAQVFLAGGRIKPEHADVVSFTSFGAMGNRALGKAGALHVIPAHLSALNAWFDSGVLRADVVLVHLSAPDENGEYSFGTAHDYAPAATSCRPLFRHPERSRGIPDLLPPSVLVPAVA